MEMQRSPVIVSGQSRGYAKGSAVTRASGFVFLSGAVGRGCETGIVPAGLAEQTKIAMENIKSRLEEYGSSLQNIVSIRLYLKGTFPDGMNNDPEIIKSNIALQKFWSENCPEFKKDNNPPVNTRLGVTALGLSELLIEIEVIAAIS